MRRALIRRFRQIHILFRDHIGVFLADIRQPLVRDLLDFILGLRLLQTLSELRVINDRQHLPGFDPIPFIHGDGFQVARDFRV